MKALTADLRLPHGLALLVGPLLAVLMYARTLDGSFLSDDFLLNIVLAKEGAEPGVLWSQVFADFGRGWLALNQTSLYRPLVTLSVAINYVLGGADPFGYHVFNVVFHAVATFAAGLLCGLCCPYRPTLAAMLGGALFALHPAAAESTCWIAARNSGMEVMWRMLAMAAFALYLRRGLRRDVVLAAAAFVLACTAKETAMMIPVGFLALDLLMTPIRPLGQRLKLHLLFAPIWLGYFLLRRSLLGVFVGHPTAENTELTVARIGTYLTFLHNKLVMVFVPFLSGMPVLRQLLFYVLLAALIVWAVRQPLVRGAVVFGFAWLVLNYLPSYELDVHQGRFGGRMLYGSVAVMAIIICMLAVRLWDRPRFVPGSVPDTPRGGQVQRYQLSYRQVAALQEQLLPHAEKSTVDRPLVLVSAMGPAGGTYFLNCNALFALAEIPIAAADRPLVSLGFIWQPVEPLSVDLVHDVSSLRAMWHMGGELLVWDPDPLRPSFPPAIDADRSPQLPALLDDGARRLFATAPVDTLRIEAVKITATGDCSGGTLRWLVTTATGPDYHRDAAGTILSAVGFAGGVAAGGVAAGGTTTFYVDLSHHFDFLAIRGSLAGFEVVFADGVEHEFSLEPIHTLPELDLARRLLGDTVLLGREHASLRAPDSPGEDLELHLVLLAPDTGAQLRVVPGNPVKFPPQWIASQKVLDRISRQRRYYYFFEARSPVGRSLEAYRSPVDWFILKRPDDATER
ncbi:MAG: hypothetical protein ACYTKC_12710 [Planctomycetota bacterium]|jgi:hypothetical protein